MEQPYKALSEFVEQSTSLFADGSSSGWRSVQGTPLAYVAGPSHRSQYTMYRIAFIIDSFLYEWLVITPPSNNTIELPLPLQAMLGSLKSS